MLLNYNYSNAIEYDLVKYMLISIVSHKYLLLQPDIFNYLFDVTNFYNQVLKFGKLFKKYNSYFV